MSNLEVGRLPNRSTVQTSISEIVFSRYSKLLDWFRNEKSVIIALSGGVDSSVVAAAAFASLGKSALAVTTNSSTFTDSELTDAKTLVKLIGIRHLVVEYDELDNPDFINNSTQRCYFCREELVKVLTKVATDESISAIVDGTNSDDLNDHRPGMLALREGGVRSPLVECGIGKADVRTIARALGLPNADKPSNACLASRFPYGQIITRDKMNRVAQAEDIVKKIAGTKQVRVRDHGDIARIEVGRDERDSFFNESIMDQIHLRLKDLGYSYVTLDLIGYRSGSMDETL
ncbi:MAG: ATP-dependent sacrificial sulfur transferase LarE [Thaumarchaeota archaeon]|nr:ATP-dependent sacrificial sulfur transferase LarE [Nitrososphaerota archaeon]